MLFLRGVLLIPDLRRPCLPVARTGICGKRLKEAIPTLVAAMEGHGHLQLEAEVRRHLFAISAATMDRALKPDPKLPKESSKPYGPPRHRLGSAVLAPRASHSSVVVHG